MTEPGTQIDYATAPPLYRRRVVRRGAVVAVLVVLAGVGYHYVTPFADRVRGMIMDRRAATVTYPPTQVVWEEDPARIAAWTGGAASGPDWATLSRSGRVRAVYLTPPALRGDFGIPWVVGGGASAIYVGARDAGAGRRIVSIAMVDQPGDRPSGASIGNGLFNVITIHPATFTTDPSIRMFRWADRDTLIRIPAGQLRLYWGQSDPADAAHFTIRFESPATSGTIDGRLMPDDMVRLKVIKGSATAPSR